MARLLALLLSALLLGACNPRAEVITLGPPATKALKTTELETDAKSRLDTLAQQTDLTSNSLFASYRKKGVSQWSQNWTRRIDFSGVSWSQRQAGTAITPRHIVLAAHYQIGPGKVITFHERSGAVHSRVVEKAIAFRGQKVPIEKRSDIAVALLDKPLPPTIKTYRLLPPREDYGQTLEGCPVLVTEQNRRVFIHRISRSSGKFLSFRKHSEFPEELYKSLIKGDSGHPSFLLVGGEPVLVETHTGGGGGSGPFYSSPAYFEALKEAVAELDPTYQIQTVPLDPQLAPAPPEKKKPAARQSPPKTGRATHNPAQNPTGKPAQGQPNKPRQPRVRRVQTPPVEAE